MKEKQKDIIIDLLGDYWVAAYKSQFDDENERTILDYGKTKEEALENALRHAVEEGERLYGIVEQTLAQFKAEPDIDFLGKRVKIPGVFFDSGSEDEVQDSVDAVWYEDGHWSYLFR